MWYTIDVIYYVKENIMNFNKVILGGRLTRDPELKILPSGTSVCEFGLAINKRVPGETEGEWEDEGHFFDVSFFGKRAEVVSEHFSKGKPILIEGNLHQDRWTDDQGKNRSRVRIRAYHFEFVGSKQESEENGNSPPTTSENPSSQATPNEDPPQDDVPF